MTAPEDTEPAVAYSLDGVLAIIRLNDPRRRNALSKAIVSGVLAALDRAREDKARAIVITGTGRVFSAGANIDDLQAGWMDGTDEETDPTRLFRALVDSPRVVIAAVQGPAVGGGFELTLCCDLVVAADSAFFQLPELGLGVIPNTGLARLAQIIGLRRALDVILTRRRVGAAEALCTPHHTLHHCTHRRVHLRSVQEAASGLGPESTPAPSARRHRRCRGTSPPFHAHAPLRSLALQVWWPGHGARRWRCSA